MLPLSIQSRSWGHFAALADGILRLGTLYRSRRYGSAVGSALPQLSLQFRSWERFAAVVATIPQLRTSRRNRRFDFAVGKAIAAIVMLSAWLMEPDKRHGVVASTISLPATDQRVHRDIAVA